MKEEIEVVRELEEAIDAIEPAGESLRQAAKRWADSAADYEGKKSQYIIQLKAEEDTDKSIKRTDMVRTAMYRSMYGKERMERMLAAEMYDVEKIVFRGLIAKVNALQTLARRFRDEA